MAAQALGKIYESGSLKAVNFNDQSQCWVFDVPHFDPKKGLITKQRRLVGVRRILSKTCWPSYSYYEAEKLNPTASSDRVKTGVRGNGRRAMNYGRRRGLEVHEQLGIVAAHGLDKLNTQLNYQSSTRRRKTVHPFVKNVLDRFEQLGWTLVASELPVYSEYYGSSVDLLCLRRRSNTLILIELKVGGDNYHRKASAFMEGTLKETGIDNSPLQQAFVQLAAYRLLFEQRYAEFITADMIDSYRVLFVGESGIHIEKLDEEKWKKLAPPLASLLCAPPPGSAAEAKATQK